LRAFAGLGFSLAADGFLFSEFSFGFFLGS